MNDGTAQDIWVGIDLGTQGVRAIAATSSGDIVGSGAHPLSSMRFEERHEQPPGEWWIAVGHASRAMCRTIDAPHRIRGVAVCGTSGTVLLTDGQGRALTPALMYDDARALAECDEANAVGAALWKKLGYQRIQSVWGLPKLMWLLRKGSDQGERYLAHQADFIAGMLSGTRLPSDPSNALKTGCDTALLRWDAAVMEQLGVRHEVLPELRRSGARIGAVGDAGAAHTGIPAGTPIVAGMTDGCAAQLSSGATSAGSWNSVLGTTLILKGATDALLPDPAGVVYSHRSPEGRWLPGGASSSGAGALTHFLPGADLDALAAKADRRTGSRALAYPLASAKGERFPFIASEATAFFLPEAPTDPVDKFLGITLGLASIERLCFDYLDLLGFPTDGRLSLTGGGTRSRFWNDLRATMLGRELVVPAVAEPAFGMAILASCLQRPLDDAVAAMVRIKSRHEPQWQRSDGALQAHLTLVDALEARGWLPRATASHARQRVAR
ncbi:FGGY-family carbohydrate kinase [Bradyrhizobium sp.]|uniref:FGGY-family carbohydrate kinase n=1 Tax=Bradyrhizobium sp. TaxID=376 RepID=UPI002736FBEB|nr:FGGY family carbohydrate kinase [Bradyrhizobium sp.]MDP3689773.1 FGGY family carbohydrate kinase [Bradyrhizobium sp.]